MRLSKQNITTLNTSLAKRLTQRTFGYLPYIAGFVILYFSNTFSSFASINGLLQIILFIAVVSVPAYFTKRMSYVDIGWPLGLVLIGVLVLVMGDGYWLRRYIIGGMYLFAGLRMGLMAIFYMTKGHLDKELNRYQFQRKRWEKGGYTNEVLSLQYEIMVQCFANITILAMPAMLQAFNPRESLTILEIAGYVLWVIAFAMEHLADTQKNTFLLKAKSENKRRQCCNVGLWKYTRHPNYFAEWMVWNALILSSVSSLMYYYSIESLMIWIGLAAALLFVSRIMYVTLVYYTGAVPSEYYSVKKRPEYEEYQKTTNMFFPGKPQNKKRSLTNPVTGKN
ncbi:MAG: steroid 5-alpha reductase family enzyme [Saprospiraceae bacterium]